MYFKNIILGLSCFVSSFSLYAEKPVSENKETAPAIFTMQNKSYTMTDLRNYLASRPVQRAEASASQEGLRSAVEEMALYQALALEGPQKGIVPASDQTINSPAYLYAVFTKLIPPCDPISEENAKKFFESYRNKFSTPLYVRTTRIFFNENIKIDNQTAENYLVNSAKQISEGNMKFDQLLEKSKNANFSSDKIGDTGFVAMEGDSGLVKALSNAKIGELVGPIKSNSFVYLFKIIERREPIFLSWEEAKSTAPEKAQAECNNIRLKLNQTALFKKYDVKINYELIEHSQ